MFTIGARLDTSRYLRYLAPYQAVHLGVLEPVRCTLNHIKKARKALRSATIIVVCKAMKKKKIEGNLTTRSAQKNPAWWHLRPRIRGLRRRTYRRGRANGRARVDRVGRVRPDMQKARIFLQFLLAWSSVCICSFLRLTEPPSGVRPGACERPGKLRQRATLKPHCMYGAPNGERDCRIC